MSRKLIEWGLIAAGILFLSACAFSFLRYQNFQAQVTQQPRRAGLTSSSSRAVPGLLGRITVPRIGLSVALVEGDDDDSLALAAGHMPGTAIGGRAGNMVVAGHRDSAFWPLRNIRTGDLIHVKGPVTSTYRVVTTKVVDPQDTTALADTKSPVLTLVTCYPFRHVGSAPKRFIVRANLVH